MVVIFANFCYILYCHLRICNYLYNPQQSCLETSCYQNPFDLDCICMMPKSDVVSLRLGSVVSWLLYNR